MTKTLFRIFRRTVEAHSCARCGGVKGVLTLGMLKALETIAPPLRRVGSFRLSDYDDLSAHFYRRDQVRRPALGLSVDELSALYSDSAPKFLARALATASYAVEVRSEENSPCAASSVSTKTLAPRTEDCLAGTPRASITVRPGWSQTIDSACLRSAGREQNIPQQRVAGPICPRSAAEFHLLDEIVIDIEFDEKRRPIQKGYFVDAPQRKTIGRKCYGGLSRPQVRLEEPAPTIDDDLMTAPVHGGRPSTVKRFQVCHPAACVHARLEMVYDTQVQGVMMRQALSNPSGRGGQFRDRRYGGVAQASPVDYQRIDGLLDTKPKVSVAAIPRSADDDARTSSSAATRADFDRAGSHGNGKKPTWTVLLEVWLAAGRTYADASYPDPKFDLPECGPLEREQVCVCLKTSVR